MPRKKQTEIKKGPAVHYTHKYLIDPPHPGTVNLIGVGGTGSQVLNSLARMNSALKSLGHPGLFVRAIDPDRVTEANMGRQLFSPADIGEYKSNVLMGRINRFFGYKWQAETELYSVESGISPANITISCVDSGKARTEIKTALEEATKALKARPFPTRNGYMQYTTEPWQVPYYWMDFGNMKDRGQVVMGTLVKVEQPEQSEFNLRETLPLIHQLHPGILKDSKADDQGPSCSLAEALGKQDLFINTNLANMGLAILWKMFRELHIKYHGLYLNLETLSTNPIKIQ